MIAAETDLDARFKRLHLANARRVWRGLIDRAERGPVVLPRSLDATGAEELAHRQQTRLARLTRRAHFPFQKAIDDFNFTDQSSLHLQMLGSALSPDFVTEGRSLILAGKPGRGNTHLANALPTYMHPAVLVVDKVGVSRTAPMPPTCSSTSSTSAIDGIVQ